MKNSVLAIILTILLSVILFFIGTYYYGNFFEWTLPNIDGITFQVTLLGGQFNGMLIFALTFALIPISAFFTWKLAPILATKRKVLNIFILLFSILLCTVVRREWLIFQSTRYLKGLPESFNNKLQFKIPIENFNITNYMLLGLLLGTVISYFSLRQKELDK